MASFLKKIKSSSNFRCEKTFVNPYCPVKCGMSYTPGQMQVLIERGIPVSTQLVNPDMFFDGIVSTSQSVPLEFSRGVDIVDVWNASKDAKQKFVNAHLNEVNLTKL